MPIEKVSFQPIVLFRIVAGFQVFFELSAQKLADGSRHVSALFRPVKCGAILQNGRNYVLNFFDEGCGNFSSPGIIICAC